MSDKKKLYLSLPYSFNPAFAHRIAGKVAASLIEDGYIVFSPVSHAHHICDHMPDQVRMDHEFWMEQDLSFVEWCDEMCVVLIGEQGRALIKQSRGVHREMQRAEELGKKVWFREFHH